MANNAIMQADDAVSGRLAECFITINGRRFNFMNLTEFESTWDVNIVDVPILGQPGLGHKTVGGSGSWSGTAHYNNSQLRALALEYQNTGVMSRFEIQVTNEDPTSKVGRQTVIHYGCLCDSFTLAKFTASDEILTEDLSGTFESWAMPETFADLEGM
jgi:hypothetical protein